MTEIAIAFESTTQVRKRRAAEEAAKPRQRYPAHVARQLALARELQTFVGRGRQRPRAADAGSDKIPRDPSTLSR